MQDMKTTGWKVVGSNHGAGKVFQRRMSISNTFVPCILINEHDIK